jgi:selenoprotein W-related protein
LKAALEKNFKDVDVKLIEGSGGVFEVAIDGKLVFSKKKTGRFPEHEEIFSNLR